MAEVNVSVTTYITCFYFNDTEVLSQLSTDRACTGTGTYLQDFRMQIEIIEMTAEGKLESARVSFVNARSLDWDSSTTISNSSMSRPLGRYRYKLAAIHNPPISKYS